jgi:hypothetical protein
LLETLGFTNRQFLITDRRAALARTAPMPDESAPVVPDMELAGWAPHVIARSKLGQRRLRPSSAAGLVVLVGLSLLAALLLRNTDTQASAEIEAAAAVVELVDSLDSVQRVALPAAPDANADLAAATAALIHLERNARVLFDVAASLPEGSETRGATASLGAAALDLGRNLGDTWTYHLALIPLWRMPELPLSGVATEEAATLAAWQVELLAARQGINPPPFLEDHRDAYERLLSEFDPWRISYLDALTANDETAAGAAVNELTATIDDLKQSLTRATGSIKQDMVTKIEELSRQAETLGQ